MPELVTGRGLNLIGLFHLLEPEDFEGKLVLDVACGKSQLQHDLRMQGIGATILGLDIREDALRENLAMSEHPIQPVLASGVKLPIAEKSVDIALSTYGPPLWLGNPDEVRMFLSEMKRVVKPGGFFSIVPMSAQTRLIWPSEKLVMDLRQEINLFRTEISHDDEWDIRNNKKDHFSAHRRDM